INQAVDRYNLFGQQTGLPWAQSMIFPYNISPVPTLVYLKEKNFQVTINSSNLPIDATRASGWDAGVYPADMEYGNFPVIGRTHADDTPYAFDLFLDKPTWTYEHRGVFNDHGITWLNPIADRINAVHGGVTWQSIDYITKKLYLQKANDDGSMSVMMYGNN